MSVRRFLSPSGFAALTAAMVLACACPMSAQQAQAPPKDAPGATTNSGGGAQPGGGRGGRGGGRGGNMDPAQFQAQRMERYRQQLEVTSDDEWKVLQPRIEKVLQAQRDVRVRVALGRRVDPAPNANAGAASRDASGAGAGQRRPRGQRGGGNADASGATPSAGVNPRFNAESNPEVAALQTAVENKASTAELKAKLGKLREKLKQEEANLVKAQQELRQLLSVRQEAIAVLLGLLRE